MFWKRKSKCPITEGDRIFVEQTFSWIIENFGKSSFSKGFLLPTKESFDSTFSGQRKDAFLVLDVVSKRMEIDSSNILLDFYNERGQVFWRRLNE